MESLGRGIHTSTILAGVFTIVAVVLLWYLFDVLLLIFASALLAILIRVPTSWLATRSGIGDGWALSIVLLFAAGLLSLAGWALGAALTQQLQSLSEQLPSSVEQARSYLLQYSWFQTIDPDVTLQGRGSKFLGRGLHVLTATFGVIANVLLVVFMAVLLSAQPDLYVHAPPTTASDLQAAARATSDVSDPRNDSQMAPRTTLADDLRRRLQHTGASCF